MDRNTGSFISFTADFYFEATPNVDQSITHHDDSINANPASPPSGTLRAHIANARLE